MDEEDYKAEELAILCRVHVSTVRRWISNGSLSAIRLPGGYYRIPAEEFDESLMFRHWESWKNLADYQTAFQRNLLKNGTRFFPRVLLVSAESWAPGVIRLVKPLEPQWRGWPKPIARVIEDHKVTEFEAMWKELPASTRNFLRGDGVSGEPGDSEQSPS